MRASLVAAGAQGSGLPPTVRGALTDGAMGIRALKSARGRGSARGARRRGARRWRARGSSRGRRAELTGGPPGGVSLSPAVALWTLGLVGGSVWLRVFWFGLRVCLFCVAFGVAPCLVLRVLLRVFSVSCVPFVASGCLGVVSSPA